MVEDLLLWLLMELLPAIHPITACIMQCGVAHGACLQLFVSMNPYVIPPTVEATDSVLQESVIVLTIGQGVLVKF